MEVQLTLARKNRVRIDAGDICETFTPTNSADRKRFAELVGLDDSQMLAYTRELETDPRKVHRGNPVTGT
jgi:hypothetical protein